MGAVRPAAAAGRPRQGSRLAGTDHTRPPRRGEGGAPVRKTSAPADPLGRLLRQAARDTDDPLVAGWLRRLAGSDEAVMSPAARRRPVPPDLLPPAAPLLLGRSDS